jgi:hypothetical protein
MTTAQLTRLLVMVALLPAEVAAQALPVLPEGTRVRVRGPALPAGSLTGNVTFATTDSMAVLGPRGVVRLAQPDINRVEVSRGRSHVRGALKGTLVGGLVGAVGMAMIGSIGDANGADEGQTISGTGAGFIIGMFVGPPVGALIGGVRGIERWRTTWERP